MGHPAMRQKMYKALEWIHFLSTFCCTVAPQSIVEAMVQVLWMLWIWFKSLRLSFTTKYCNGRLAVHGLGDWWPNGALVVPDKMFKTFGDLVKWLACDSVRLFTYLPGGDEFDIEKYDDARCFLQNSSTTDCCDWFWCFEALQYIVASPWNIILYHSRFLFYVKLLRVCTLCRRCADLGTWSEFTKAINWRSRTVEGPLCASTVGHVTRSTSGERLSTTVWLEITCASRRRDTRSDPEISRVENPFIETHGFLICSFHLTVRSSDKKWKFINELSLFCVPSCFSPFYFWIGRIKIIFFKIWCIQSEIFYRTFCRPPASCDTVLQVIEELKDQVRRLLELQARDHFIWRHKITQARSYELRFTFCQSSVSVSVFASHILVRNSSVFNHLEAKWTKMINCFYNSSSHYFLRRNLWNWNHCHHCILTQPSTFVLQPRPCTNHERRAPCVVGRCLCHEGGKGQDGIHGYFETFMKQWNNGLLW